MSFLYFVYLPTFHLHSYSLRPACQIVAMLNLSSSRSQELNEMNTVIYAAGEIYENGKYLKGKRTKRKAKKKTK